MDGPRIVWWTGPAVVASGVLYGLYWSMTREGLGALGGVLLGMLALGAGTALCAAAVAWSARRAPLPVPMLAATFVLGLGTLAIAVVVLGSPRVSVPLLAVATAALATSWWAWTRRSA